WDGADERSLGGDLRVERSALVGGQRHEQTARCLRIEAERFERRVQLVTRDVTAREVAVARIAARPHAVPGEIESAVDRGEPLRLEADPHAAALRHLVRAPAQ